MSIPGSAEPLLLAQQDTGYKIERSLRFNSSDSAYLSRTPASAGNRKTWTWSGWVKRAGLGTFQTLLHSGADSENATQLRFNSADTIKFEHQDASVETGTLVTSQVFRDVSAWYHIVLACDTTQATDTNRLKLYVNGTQVTTFSSSTYPSQNADLDINTTTSHRMGGSILSTNYLSGYLADIHFIDGQALTPSSFAETNATTGQWVPKAYSGSYGTNGFQLKFADNSAATATTLGKDTSGNGNNWTPNNLSVTAGAGNDSLVDTPTSYGTDDGLGGSVRGNYCTLNPLSVTAGTFTNGNLEYVGPSSFRRANGTTSVFSGKWYWEVTTLAASRDSAYNNRYNGWGIGLSTTFNSSDLAPVDCFIYWDTGQYQNWSSTTVTATSVAANDVLGFALNLDANTITVTRNGSTVVNAVTLGVSAGTVLTPFHLSYDATYSRSAFNFGQRSFAYTAPSGFKALCDTNLPAPVVAKPSESFQTVLWTGDNTSNRTITTGLRSGFVWIKNRSATGPTHILHDVVRGAGQTLYTSSTSAEVNNGTAYVQQFNATNFLLGATDSACNASGASYVGWVWDPGANTVTNTQGSITSQVRANASAGFSIVTYTGTGSTASVGHGLNALPQMIIVKRRDSTGNWAVYHRTQGANTYLFLNSTAAAAAISNYWQYTPSPGNPTSDWFGIIGGNDVNASSATYVAYCFAAVAGYSSFGSYTGNGSSDGPFVYTGMRPRWILIKRTDATQNWPIIDTSRDTYNIMNRRLFANLSDAEDQGIPNFIDVTANGFKCRDSNISYNASGGTYIYAAFAENPFQYARAR